MFTFSFENDASPDSYQDCENESRKCLTAYRKN